MDRRVFGLETEYGIIAQNKGISAQDATILLLDQKRKKGEFLTNGGRLYPDCDHPEYATPECLTPREASLYHYAGDVIMGFLARAARKNKLRIDTYRDNVGFDGQFQDSRALTYGCHENYLITNLPWEPDIKQTLVPFLVSRILLFGSGHLDRHNHYYLSQRALFLDGEESDSPATQGSRSILNRRHESFLKGILAEKYRRLHITCGDVNVNPILTELKLGTTALVLSYIEAGYSLSYLFPVDTVQAMQAINSDQSGRIKVDLRSGKSLTALEMQHHYCDAVGRFLTTQSQRRLLEPWMWGIHTAWTQMLDDLGRCGPDDWSHHGPMPDWKIKRYLWQLWRMRYGNKIPYDKLFGIGLDYHNTNPPKHGVVHALESWLGGRFTGDQLWHAATHPPSFERPRERSQRVMEFEANKKGIADISWSGYMLNNRFQHFPFPDIFDN